MMKERRSHLLLDAGVRYVLHATGHLEGLDPAKIDRADLMAEDHGVPGLPSVPTGNDDLRWVSGLSSRDRADRRHLGCVKGFSGDDERAPFASLLVPDRRIETDDDDRPSEVAVHAGQCS